MACRTAYRCCAVAAGAFSSARVVQASLLRDAQRRLYVRPFRFRRLTCGPSRGQGPCSLTVDGKLAAHRLAGDALMAEEAATARQNPRCSIGAVVRRAYCQYASKMRCVDGSRPCAYLSGIYVVGWEHPMHTQVLMRIRSCRLQGKAARRLLRPTPAPRPYDRRVCVASGPGPKAPRSAKADAGTAEVQACSLVD